MSSCWCAGGIEPPDRLPAGANVSAWLSRISSDSPRSLNARAALVASAPLSKPKYATNFLPMTAAETPRKFIPASAIAAAIRPPRPAASSPSTFNVATFLAGARPTDCAAFRTAAPFAGVRNTTPVPGFAGSRRAMTQSRLPPAFPSAPRTFARPPGLILNLGSPNIHFRHTKAHRGLLSFEFDLRANSGRGKRIRSRHPSLVKSSLRASETKILRWIVREGWFFEFEAPRCALQPQSIRFS